MQVNPDYDMFKSIQGKPMTFMTYILICSQCLACFKKYPLFWQTFINHGIFCSPHPHGSSGQCRAFHGVGQGFVTIQASSC